MASTKWNAENIKEGIERYIAEFGVPPTARDFDKADYLPSARQIQRGFGGMSAIREKLGYVDLDFTKGNLRTAIATNASARGIAAEEYFEPLLTKHFGEPFVHTQKRYAEGTKNRYDFFIYAKNRCLGVDIFTTTKTEYIAVNVRHKINRYKDLNNVETYFVLIGEDYTDQDIITARLATPTLSKYSNLHLVGEREFLGYIHTIDSLEIPKYFTGTTIANS